MRTSDVKVNKHEAPVVTPVFLFLVSFVHKHIGINTSILGLTQHIGIRAGLTTLGQGFEVFSNTASQMHGGVCQPKVLNPVFIFHLNCLYT